MRILFLGDVVGRAGRNAVIERLPLLRERYRLDFVVVNGENAAGGFGITEQILIELLDAGADVVTTGNHVFDQRETLVFIERCERLLRPINFRPARRGRGRVVQGENRRRDPRRQRSGPRVHGRSRRSLPRRRARAQPRALKTGADAILIDFHAEATSEKEAMGHFADGRATAVIGTHTHVPTADEQILRKGTAYISDAGMCGDFDSISGWTGGAVAAHGRDRAFARRGDAVRGRRRRGRWTGLARAIAPQAGGRLSQAEPAFWSEGS